MMATTDQQLQENVEIAEKMASEVWSEGNLSMIEEYVDESIVAHNTLQEIEGIEAYEGWVEGIRTTAPDFAVDVEEIVGVGDLVAARYTLSGTHEGYAEFLGLEPTGKHFAISGMMFVRFAGGKAIEEWHVDDVMGMMHQLGVMPESPAA